MTIDTHEQWRRKQWRAAFSALLRGHLREAWTCWRERHGLRLDTPDQEAWRRSRWTRALRRLVRGDLQGAREEWRAVVL